MKWKNFINNYYINFSIIIKNKNILEIAEIK